MIARLRPLRTLLALTGFALFSITLSCVNHEYPQYVCKDEPISWQNDVLPIINTKCAIPNCHNGSLGPDLVWTDYTKIKVRAESGILKFRVTNRIMPPAFSTEGPLSQDQINTIACWVDQGALEN